MSTSKKIPHDFAARIDELVSATNSEEMAESNTSQNTANFDLSAIPDLETICKKKNTYTPLYSCQVPAKMVQTCIQQNKCHRGKLMITVVMLISLTKRLCLNNCNLSQTSQQPVHPKCTLSTFYMP